MNNTRFYCIVKLVRTTHDLIVLKTSKNNTHDLIVL